MRYRVQFPHDNTVEYLGTLYKNGRGIVDEETANMLRGILSIKVTEIPESPVENKSSKKKKEE